MFKEILVVFYKLFFMGPVKQKITPRHTCKWCKFQQENKINDYSSLGVHTWDFTIYLTETTNIELVHQFFDSMQHLLCKVLELQLTSMTSAIQQVQQLLIINGKYRYLTYTDFLIVRLLLKYFYVRWYIFIILETYYYYYSFFSKT